MSLHRAGIDEEVTSAHLAGPERRWTGTAGNVLILLIAVTVTLLMLEGAMRWFGMLDPITYRSDPLMGYEPSPNQSATRLGIPIYSNDVGLRDNEDRAAFVESQARILVVGDSVTYGGSRIRQDDLFTEVLERELRPHRGAIKVMNAGVNGYSVSQMMERARRLLGSTTPTTLVVFAIRGDFFRPPVQFIREGSSPYPLRRPSSALVEFFKLAIGHMDNRYRVLPTWLRLRIEPPGTYVPPFDGENIVDVHFAEFEEFLSTAWEPSGRSRNDVVVFFSPTTAELLADEEPNRDLVQRLAAMKVRAFDLHREYSQATVARGEPVTDYYFDTVHYGERGHALAGRIVAAHLLDDGSPIASTK